MYRLWGYILVVVAIAWLPSEPALAKMLRERDSSRKLDGYVEMLDTTDLVVKPAAIVTTPVIAAKKEEGGLEMMEPVVDKPTVIVPTPAAPVIAAKKEEGGLEMMEPVVDRSVKEKRTSKRPTVRMMEHSVDLVADKPSTEASEELIGGVEMTESVSNEPARIFTGCGGSEFGCCDDGKTAKADMVGINCVINLSPTKKEKEKETKAGGVIMMEPVAAKPLLGGCKGTQFGCCPDQETTKADITGINCISAPKDEEEETKGVVETIQPVADKPTVVSKPASDEKAEDTIEMMTPVHADSENKDKKEPVEDSAAILEKAKSQRESYQELLKRQAEVAEAEKARTEEARKEQRERSKAAADTEEAEVARLREASLRRIKEKEEKDKLEAEELQKKQEEARADREKRFREQIEMQEKAELEEIRKKKEEEDEKIRLQKEAQKEAEEEEIRLRAEQHAVEVEELKKRREEEEAEEEEIRKRREEERSESLILEQEAAKKARNPVVAELAAQEQLRADRESEKQEEAEKLDALREKQREDELEAQQERERQNNQNNKNNPRQYNDDEVEDGWFGGGLGDSNPAPAIGGVFFVLGLLIFYCCFFANGSPSSPDSVKYTQVLRDEEAQDRDVDIDDWDDWEDKNDSGDDYGNGTTTSHSRTHSNGCDDFGTSTQTRVEKISKNTLSIGGAVGKITPPEKPALLSKSRPTRSSMGNDSSITSPAPKKPIARIAKPSGGGADDLFASIGIEAKPKF